MTPLCQRRLEPGRRRRRAAARCAYLQTLPVHEHLKHGDAASVHVLDLLWSDVLAL